jgi:hypothetical protein
MKTLSRSHRAERQSEPSWSTAKVQAPRAPFALTQNVRYIIRAVLLPSTRMPRRDGSSTKKSRPVAGVSKRTEPNHSAASSRMCPLAAAQELRREFDEQSVRISHCVVKMRSNSQISLANSNIEARVS